MPVADPDVPGPRVADVASALGHHGDAELPFIRKCLASGLDIEMPGSDPPGPAS